MTILENIETRHGYTFPTLYKKLWEDEMLNFQFPELWDTEKHHFIPFAKTAEGNVYAFYENLEVEGENPIVLIWDDMDETEIIAKNFEDFIFRKMLEITEDIDKEDLDTDYGKAGIEGYRTDLLTDLKSITPYIKDEYVTVLTDIYSAEVQEMLFSYGFKSEKRLNMIIKEMLDFEYLDDVIEHEV